MRGFISTTDHMTLDQINEALKHYDERPIGKMTPADADRRDELMMAKRRITGRDSFRGTWGLSVTAPTDTPGLLPAMYCEHANEVPMSCQCPGNCYCQQHTCRGRR